MLTPKLLRWAGAGGQKAAKVLQHTPTPAQRPQGESQPYHLSKLNCHAPQTAGEERRSTWTEHSNMLTPIRGETALLPEVCAIWDIASWAVTEELFNQGCQPHQQLMREGSQ